MERPTGTRRAERAGASSLPEAEIAAADALRSVQLPKPMLAVAIFGFLVKMCCTRAYVRIGVESACP